MLAARRQLVATLICSSFWLVGCDQATPLNAPMLTVPPGPDKSETALPSVATLTPVFIDADMVHLQQVFLLNGLAAFEKAERWSQFYKQRWVRYTGQLKRIDREALCFRQFGATGMYDVLLKTVRKVGQPPPEYKVGRFYNYVGRLERFDDGFRTFYLDQGVVLDAGPDGVPGVLVEGGEQTRQLPPPPKIIPPPLP